jgi:hypothetical protein
MSVDSHVVWGVGIYVFFIILATQTASYKIQLD